MIVGIDLGTTNSLVAVWEDNVVKVIPNVLGKQLTPSIISVDEDDILIGEAALNRLVTHNSVTCANFKRFMGSDKIFTLGKYKFRAEELSALILKRLKEDAEAYLGQPVEEAVISVPAYFSDAQRKATKIAGKLAGLKVERLINEPTAAGIAYGLQAKEDDTNYLIFDLGGGTFDVSILNLFSSIIEVRSSSGDNYLGGIDFTNIIESSFIENQKNQSKLPTNSLDPILIQKIHEQAEYCKHKLSIEPTVLMKVKWENELLQQEITQDHFEKLCNQLLERIQVQVKKAVNDAKLHPSKIDQIILAGGSSRMPLIKKMVAKMFGKLPLCHLNPDTVIVQGAAIQSALKADNKDLEEFVVTDVCPYSLGVGVAHPSQPGILHFDPIIERNTTIPTSRSRVYHPAHEQQKHVEIKIYQGEHFYVDKNVYLGMLMMPIPVGIKNRSFEIRFTYDINGLLEVEAKLNESGEKKNLIIEGNPGVLNEQQIKEKIDALAALKIHPRDKTENKAALNLAQRLYQDLQGEARQYLGKVISDFASVIENQNEQEILRARKSFELLLNELQTNLEL